MTGQEFKRVLEAYEAIRARDLDRVLALVSDDSVVNTRIESYRGRDAVLGMFQEAFASDFDNDQDGFILADDEVVALTRLRLVGPTTGIESHERVLEAWRITDTGLNELRVLDHRDGLRQLGLEQEAADVVAIGSLYDLLAKGDRGGAVKLFPTIEIDLSELEGVRPELLIHNGEQVAALIRPDAHLWTMHDGLPVAVEFVDDHEAALASICERSAGD